MANKAAATLFTPETKEESSELSRLTSVASGARIGFVLLLKTTLPRPAATYGGSNRANLYQYNGAGIGAQRIQRY